LRLFGTKIPEMGKGLGEGIRSFQSAIKGPTPEKPDEVAEEEQPAAKV